MKIITSVTVFNDAVGTRMSATYSEIDDATGRIISDNNRFDRVITDNSAAKTGTVKMTGATRDQGAGVWFFSGTSTFAMYGGTIDATADHRIAMSAAIAATVASGDVTIVNAACVSKSYPKFWEEYRRLGGNYEQYLR